MGLAAKETEEAAHLLIIKSYCFWLWRIVSQAKTRSPKPIRKVDCALIEQRRGKTERPQNNFPVVLTQGQGLGVAVTRGIKSRGIAWSVSDEVCR